MTVEATVTYEPKKNPGDKLRKVLVVQLGPMRSFLQGIAASAYVRRTHRSAHITFLTEPRFKEFATACPYFNDVEIFEKRTEAFVLKKLKTSKYEMVYDFQNDPVSHSIASNIKPKYLSSRKAKASHSVPSNFPPAHYTQDVADQLFAAGISPIENTQPTRWTSKDRPKPDYTWVKAAIRNSPRLEPAFFNLYDRYALVIPGGPMDESEECWSTKKFANLCQKIANAGVIPVIIGNSTQGRAGQIIGDACEKSVNLISRADMFQMIALAQKAEFFVGGETGPTYLVASTNLSGVVIFRQDWSPEYETQFDSIWNPETRLGRLCPQGGSLIVNHAADIEELQPNDIWTSILAMNVL